MLPAVIARRYVNKPVSERIVFHRPEFPGVRISIVTLMLVRGKSVEGRDACNSQGTAARRLPAGRIISSDTTTGSPQR